MFAHHIFIYPEHSTDWRWSFSVQNQPEPFYIKGRAKSKQQCIRHIELICKKCNITLSFAERTWE